MKKQPKGYSLHIGVNRLSPDSETYAHPIPQEGGGRSVTSKDLRACENDAMEFARLAIKHRFQKINLLLSEYADSKTFFKLLSTYQRELRSGDLFLLTFSGHGGQIMDHSGDDADGLDEVWCFYDTIVSDDQLFDAWSGFEEGVRIVVVSDSCHSGDILKNGNEEASPKSHEKRIFQDAATRTAGNIASSVQVLAACRSHQLTRESFTQGKWHGAFTNCILTHHENESDLSYSELFEKVEGCTSKSQNPHREFLGVENEAFFHGPAFKINSSTVHNL